LATSRIRKRKKKTKKEKKKNWAVAADLYKLSGEALKLSLAQVFGLTADATLGPTKGNVHHACFPGHQAC